MQGIDLATTQFVWVMTKTDKERLQEEPPAIRADLTELNPELQAEIERSAEHRARRYDYYQDIEYIGTLTGGECRVHHVVFGDNHTVPQEGYAVPTARGLSALRGHAAEWSALQAFWDTARPEHGVQILAGWRIADWLPMLVCKSMQYGIAVPDQYRTDPMKRFNTVDNVLSVEVLYTQNNRSPGRPLPELADLLTWWNVQQVTGLPYPTDKQLRELDEKGWTDVGCRAVEQYLHGMRDLVARYYGYA